MSKYEHIDASEAMSSALISLARMVHLYGSEETARDEAANILRTYEAHADDAAWLIDALAQMALDFDAIRSFSEIK